MGKTYSKKQKWIEMHAEQGKKVSRYRKHGLFSLGYQPAYNDVNEKLTRHPNKKSKKSSLRTELREVNGPCSSLADYRNQLGEIWERSSRLRLAKSTGVGSRRAKIKKHTMDEINNFLMDG